jgi:RNA polymerase sigma factor (sigma-70 family)
VEASALRAPALTRRPLAAPLLKLRSDEQLIALFRAGSEEAFSAIHDRYRQRLFAYVRQMLASGPRADAEDVLQDVFVRAYRALRADDREVNVKAWLYRVAHNRCIDHLRRPAPPAQEVFEMSRTPLQDPIETAQRRDDLKRLVEDVGRLPEQQRSALLMREIDGLAYADIAAALEVTVPAVKSLLVRARTGLVDAIQARDTDCAVIRGDLVDAYDRGDRSRWRPRPSGSAARAAAAPRPASARSAARPRPARWPWSSAAPPSPRAGPSRSRNSRNPTSGPHAPTAPCPRRRLSASRCRRPSPPTGER